MSRFTFLTPTYKGDLERFRLQRESMERTGVDRIPHIAVVHQEDLPDFRVIPFARNLTLLSTQEVLSPEIEGRRTRKGITAKQRDPIEGWVTQQIIKLSAPELATTEAVVCLDSDVYFLRPVSDEDFFHPDGRLFLFEVEEEFSQWFLDSWAFLGLPSPKPTERLPFRHYVFMLPPLHCQVVRDMQRHIEERHQKVWWEAFVEHGVTEYMTYGLFARYINQQISLAPITPSHGLCLTFWPGGEEPFEAVLRAGVAVHQPKAISIQSSTGRDVSQYYELIKGWWSGK